MDDLSFDYSSYIEWHNKKFPSDSPLDVNTEKMIAALKNEAASKFTETQQVLGKIRAHTESEARIQSGGLLDGLFEMPFESFKESSLHYPNLFKSKESIINKLYRKNNHALNNNYVTLANIKEKVVDLVRTSIVAPTMFHAELFSERLLNWQDILGDDVKLVCPNIKTIDVDKEAQLASGYFAYHALIIFKDGYKIEVQIYSKLISAWRAMSHKLYEDIRVGNKELIEPGSPNSRLVSLGHMLHLAECELDRLQNDLTKYRKTSTHNK